jgi:hypothetical protein
MHGSLCRVQGALAVSCPAESVGGAILEGPIAAKYGSPVSATIPYAWHLPGELPFISRKLLLTDQLE